MVTDLLSFLQLVSLLYCFLELNLLWRLLPNVCLLSTGIQRTGFLFCSTLILENDIITDLLNFLQLVCLSSYSLEVSLLWKRLPTISLLSTDIQVIGFLFCSIFILENKITCLLNFLQFVSLLSCSPEVSLLRMKPEETERDNYLSAFLAGRLDFMHHVCCLMTKSTLYCSGWTLKPSRYIKKLY